MIKQAGVALAAAVVAFVGFQSSAEAGARLRFGFYPYEPAYGGYYYYGQPYFAPGPEYYYYQPRRRAYAYEYEPDYYEPQPDSEEPDTTYAPPPTKKSNLPGLKTQTIRKQSGPVSCDKAKKIVSDYGFTQVEPKSCEGKVYAFSARRDGKPFSIKMSAASGELTEVKKQ
ncbi:MAG: hypothetical protein ACJ8AS_12140 [Hyphomicrobiales bacterium]